MSSTKNVLVVMNSTVMNSTCKDLLFQLSGQPVVTLVDSGDQARQNARLRTCPKATSAHTPAAHPKVESQVSTPSIPSSYFKAMARQSSQHSAGNGMFGLMKSN